MRQYGQDVAAAANDVYEFFLANKATLPEHVVEKLAPHMGIGTSPVDRIVHFTEAVYANIADMPAEAMEIAAGCADTINQNGYHGKLDGRAPKLIPVLRRESGESAVTGRPWPKKADDLPALEDYQAPPPEPDPPADPAAEPAPE